MPVLTIVVTCHGHVPYTRLVSDLPECGAPYYLAACLEPLHMFQLPLCSGGPPSRYGWQERPPSSLSTTAVFHTEIYQRGIFSGEGCCIVCGEDIALDHCQAASGIQRHPKSEGHVMVVLPEPDALVRV